ncbi:MAG: PAS domain S-box protein [Verrucomicrobia bacterium]|nr:PAS domain S-box protein [Verrucomicrobiota bacterium]
MSDRRRPLINLAALRVNARFHAAALLGLVATLLVDAVYREATLTPFLGLSVLALLAFRLGPRALTGWVVIYSVAVFFMLDLSLHEAAEQLRANPTPWIRMASFIIAGAIAVMFSRHRHEAAAQQQVFRELLSRLPAAVIVSDENGIIQLANEKAARLIGLSVADLTGFSYFSVLMDPVNRGKAIQRYVDLFQSKSVENVEQAGQFRIPGNRVVSGVSILFRNLERQLLITVIEDKSANA